MKDTVLPRIAIISSLSGGLGHYCAHLYGPLSQYYSLRFLTYPQLDLSGTLVKQITDSFVRQHIKSVRFDIDESNPQSIVTINDYLKSREIELVNIHVATTVKRQIEYFTTFVLYGKKIESKKFVFTLHDVLPFDEDKKLIKLLKVFYGLADYFIVGNEHEKAMLMRYFDIPESKISIIPHGIYNLFDRNLYTSLMSRSFLGIQKDTKVILFFGWLREYKGFDCLIKAAKILQRKKIKFIIYVASGLKYAPKELVEKYLLMIQKNELQDYFVLNLNYLDSLDIEAVFKASDIVALPYTHVSQSGVVMMAFGFKKPVVITDAFYAKGWINEKAGLVARAADPKSLADKLLVLIKDQRKAEDFGQYGYEYASKNFDWKDIAKQYKAVFQKLMK